MIFRKESVEATFSLDEKTDLRCIAKNIDEAKKMAEEHSGKKLVLTGWKIVLVLIIINKDIKIIVNIDQNKREIMRENITGGL